MTTQSAPRTTCKFCEFKTAWVDLTWTTILGVTGYICKWCVNENSKGTLVVDNGVPWWDEDDVYSPFASVPSTTTKFVAQTCHHNLTPFTVVDGVVIYLSASSDLKTPTQGPLPDVGVYLDSDWNEGGIFVNDGKKTKVVADDLPTMFINWPDLGTISTAALGVALAWVAPKIKAGKKVEVGCFGGHGRTGTFTAALCVVHGMTADEAVAHVRSTYCKWAIESKAQEAAVAALEEALRPTATKEDDDVNADAN